MKGVCRVPAAHGKAQIALGVAHGKEHTTNSSTVNLIFTHGQIVDIRQSFLP